MNSSLRLPITDGSQAGEARRLAASWARDFGIGTELAGTLALVVTELGTNLARHTRGGVLLLRLLRDADEAGVEILSIDSGPGVANFAACLRDGHSTAGTSGIGLGAVQRASSVFEVHSQVGVGTVLLSELWTRPPVRVNEGFYCGVANVPLTGEEKCGDSWGMRQLRPDRVRLIVADGLGHGELAATASQKAVDLFHQDSSSTLSSLLETLHGALRSTRGAAVAIAEIDSARGQLTYAGIGNIAATIVEREKTTSLVSHNGTVGVQYRSMKEFIYPWTPGASLVMQSDGIKSHWQMDRYLGLSERHPGLIAGALYRDFHRTNDDSTVVVLRART